MTFQDQLKLDNDTFLNPDEFAETITYRSYVRPNVYTSVTIKAVVTRDPLQRIAESTQGLERTVEISIANDATTGRDVIKLGQDRVVLPYKIGGTPDEMTVTQIIEGDSAMWRLKVR